MGKPSTNTVTQQSQPPAYVANAFQNAVSQAQQVASTPYTPYSGLTVAPLTGNQYSAYDFAQNLPSSYQPYANKAQNYLQQATTPLYSTVGQYESPYINDVVNATEQQFNNQNAIQQNQVVGNAVAQGAWGGDRSAVAQGIVAGQQQANEAPVIAGLYNQGFQTALNANEAQNWLASQAASQEGQLGVNNTNTELAAIQGLANTGSIEQGETQSELNVPYYQYLASQAYPFQTTGWLANIAEGLGAGAGGTGSTTSPGASPISQALGLGIGGVGLLGATGAFGSSGYLTGAGGLFGGLGSDAALSDIGASTTTLGGDAALAGLFRRGGIVRRDTGGDVSQPSASSSTLGSILSDEALINSIDWRGGRVRRQDGGEIPFQLGPLPYQQIPASQNIPNVGISIVPQLPQQRAGTGPPRPPQGMPVSAGITPASILGQLGISGALGKNGWLNELLPASSGADAYDVGASPASTFPQQARGGIVRMQDGGDLVSGMTLPDQPMYLGISPDMRASAGPTIGAPQPAPSVSPASRAGVVNFWMQQGASPAAAQGIADRVAAESGFSPTASGDLGTSHGLYQEHGPRAEGLRDFADSAGASPNDPSVQNAFAASEVHGGDPIATRHWQEIENAPDRQTAATLWDKYFERSAGSRPRASDQAVLGVSPPGSPPLEAQFTTEPPPPSLGIGSSAMPADTGSAIDQLAGMYGPGVNPWLALAAAGFATAAGRSPQAAQNIGAGFLSGVQTLEGERAALPEQELRLSEAQMARLQVQNAAAMRAYFSGQTADPAPVSGQIDRNISAARGAVSDLGETHAQATPTGIMAPLPDGQNAGAPLPLSADEQGIHAQVQGQIANIDAIIERQSALAQFATTPEQMSSMQSTLAQLAIRRSELLREDPAYMRAASGASAEGKIGPEIQEAWGKVGPAVAQAGAEAQLKPGYARPGSYITQGTQVVGAVPVQRSEVDLTTGAEYPRFVTPPLPGQETQANAGPNGPGQQTQAPIRLGPGQETALKERAEAEQKDRQETIEEGEAAQGQQAILSRLKDDAQQFSPGPLAGYTQTANSYMRALFGTNAPQVASYEDFIKNAGALTRAAVRETSSRAAVQEFRLIDATLPSPQMSPQGLQQVINEYQGLNDWRLAKVQAQQGWEQQHGGIGNVQGFETDWQNKVSPYAFVFNRMAPNEQAGLVSRLRSSPEGQREIAALTRQLQYLKQSGLESVIQ